LETKGFPTRALRWGRNRILSLYDYIPGWLFTLTEGRRLRSLRDIHAGERCFVIGNGPSLAKHDLTKLANEKKFATNMFVVHPDLEKIHLDYYCVSDCVMWMPAGRFSQPCIEAFQKLPYCAFFLDKSYLPYHMWSRDLHNSQVYFVNVDERRHAFEGDFSVDIPSHTSWGRTVIIDLCLPLAFYLGFKEVFLLGCDCDFGTAKVADGPKAGARFYDSKQDTRQLSAFDTEEWYDQTISSYRVAREVFEANGRKIYNAGVGGKLEVFERVNYDSLF